MKRGELIAIVGSVGSGKSSLIAAILGEISATPETRIEVFILFRSLSLFCVQKNPTRTHTEKKSPTKNKKVNGRVVFMSQSPFIMNRSVRENITVGLKYDPRRYGFFYFFYFFIIIIFFHRMRWKIKMQKIKKTNAFMRLCWD